MAKIKKNLKHLKKKKMNEDLKSIFALVQLLKKDTNAIKFLEKMRINPKLNKISSSKKQSVKLRSDLEFFLPQILSHYLREDLTDNEEITISKLIIQCCDLNIFFAHKVWFMLKASLVNKDNREQIMKILTLLSEIEIQIQSNNEKLWIANSDSLIKLITKTNLSNILSDECVQLNLEEEKIRT